MKHENTHQFSNLEDFAGWGEETETDFFTEETVEDVVKPKEKVEKTEEQEEEEDEVNFFEQEEIINAKVEEEEEEEEKSIPKSNSIQTLNFLKEKGLANFELEEGEELTEELAEEILEDSFEDTIEERIKEKLQALPEKAQDFIQYALKGGDLDKYISEVSKTSFNRIFEDMDLDEEKNQELVVREMLLADEEDAETIEAQIEFLKDSGKLESYAQKKFDKWKKENTLKKTALLKQQEEAVKQQKEQLKLAKLEALEFVEKVDSLGGLKLSREDKRTIPSYMNDRTIKLQNGSSISEMQKELFYDLPKNKEAFMQLAVLLKNRNKDGTFNFKSIEKEVTTKITKEVKENVRRSKTSIPKSVSTNKDSNNKSLAEYFNN